MLLIPKVMSTGDLKISTDEEGQATLRALQSEDPEAFGTDDFLWEMFEHLIANSEYEWVRPEECSALTAAPILGIFGPERPAHEGEDLISAHIAGSWADEHGVNRVWVQDVEKAWGFMDYALRSPQDDLLAQGYCVFSQGE